MPALREIFAEYDVVFDRQRNLQRGDQDVTRLSRSLRRLRSVAGRITGALGSGVNQLALALGGAATVHAFSQFVESTIQMGDALDKTSQQLGLSVRELQAFQHAANLGGVDSSAFAQSMGQLQRNAEMASRGTGEAAEMFERLGVEVVNADGELKTGSELLVDVARGLNDLENSTERVAISSTLMGRSGRRLLPMFSSIARGTGEIEAEMDRLGGGMSDVAVEHSVRLTDSLARMRFAMLAIRSAVAEKILPVLERLVLRITELISEFGSAENVMRTVRAVLVGLGAAAVIGAALTISAWGPVVLAFLAVAAAAGVVALAYDQISRTINGANTKLREYLDSEELLGQGGTEGLLLLLSDRWENMKQNISNATDALVSFGETIQPILSALQSVWEMITFISSGFGLADVIRDQILPDGILGGIRGAAQARVREERAREGARRDTESFARGMDPQNRAVEELERSTRWEGPGTDIAGQPLSVPELARTREIPTIPRSAAIETARLPRPERAQAQSISIESQPIFNFDISEATDADEVTRLVTREVTQAQSRWVSELESLISDQTEVGS